MANLPEGFVLDKPSVPEGFVLDEPEQRTTGQELTRQGGLTARYATEGGLAPFTLMADAVALGMNKALKAAGVDYQFPNQSQLVSETLTEIGLPQPETGGERIIGDVSRGLAAASPGVAAGKALAGAANQTTQRVGTILRDVPGMQAAGAATAGGAAGVARESGLGPAAQAGVGLAAGVIAPTATIAGGRAAAAAGRTVQGIRETATDAGRGQVVGGLLRERATSPSGAVRAIDKAPESLTPQSTGPTSRDPGLLSLERTLRSTDVTGKFSAQQSASNARRQDILDVLGGGDVKALRASRDATTGAQREAAFDNAKAIDTSPVLKKIDAMLASPGAARKVVRNALNEFRKEIEDVNDPRVLYEIRKDIGQAMEGKLRNPERSDFGQAKRQLIVVKNAIDDTIEDAAPGFKQYLSDYAKLSKWIDQKEIVQNIQERARLAVPDSVTGREVLSQARFRRMVNAEQKNGDLTPDQLKVLGAIADDLDLGSAVNASTTRPQGSDTAKNLTTAHIIGRAIGGQKDSPIMNALTKPIRWITEFTEDQIQELLADAMLDPKLARQLLLDATPANVERISKSLRTIAGAASAGAAEGSSP